MTQAPLPPFGFTGNALSWICWTLWTSRNQLLFENRHQSAIEVFTRVLGALKEWESAQQSNKTQILKAYPSLLMPSVPLWKSYVTRTLRGRQEPDQRDWPGSSLISPRKSFG
ncbi:hypothetical protein YC2023_114761 [Brassica napus]|uniref:Uncharacterized protein n=1 Tax=Brassica oleracea TaxID=3712 RepID=A0A3P6DPL9_BRAOL|nr:unnamed protein product [Brassica oleracea]